jgi:hypothetical protein
VLLPTFGLIPMTSETYVSIFLQPDWINEAYYGWSVLDFEPGRLKVLGKQRSWVKQHLVMSRGAEERELASLIASLSLISPRSITTLHDFCATHDEPRTLHGRIFQPLTSTERMLNSATYVVDLRIGEDDLWSQIGSKTRNMVRRAQGAGVVAQMHNAPGAYIWEHFLRFYTDLERRFALRPVQLAALHRMVADGRLYALTCKDPGGTMLLVNLVYISSPYAYFLHGASTDDLPPGTGQLAQWTAMLQLKGAGILWYDLGGVPPDPANGIHRFKASLGGIYCDLGREVRYTPPALDGVYRAYRKLRRSAWRWHGR